MTAATAPTDAKLIVLMTHIATTATSAVEAISQERLLDARRLVDRLRVQWSTLLSGDARQLQSRHSHAHSADGVEAVHHGTEVLAICNQVIESWARGRLETLLGQGGPVDVDGWHTLLDQQLPMCWNFQCDLLVVHGHLPEALAEAIRARGQARTLLLGPPPLAPLPAGVVHLADEDAILTHVGALTAPLPKRQFGIDLADGLVSSERVAQLKQLVERSIQNLRMNWNTWRKLSDAWLRQGLDNLPAIAAAPDLQPLGERFAGRPAIVVSPGPSLARNIQWLKQVQGRALLLAPLQVLRRLHAEGIRADFALVLDAIDQSQGAIDFLRGIPDEDLPDLIASTSAHPNVLRHFRRVHFFSSRSPVDLLTAPVHSTTMPQLAAGSVSISCFKLAQHWRCSPIVLVGQDLAFSDGQRYAAATGSDMAAPSRFRELPGYHGGTVQTAPDYFLFHHQFEELAAAMRREAPQVRLFNCTEGGAHIAGFEQQPLAEVLQAHVFGLAPLANPQDLPSVPPPANRRQALADCLGLTLKRLREVLGLIGQSEALARRAHRGGPPVRQRMAQLDTLVRTHMQQLKHLMSAHTADLDEALTAWEAFDGLEAYLDGARRYHGTAREGLQGLEGLLVEAQQTLQSGQACDALAQEASGVLA